MEALLVESWDSLSGGVLMGVAGDCGVNRVLLGAGDVD